MFNSFKKKKPGINWKHLEKTEGLNELNEQSKSDPVMIFKHSTRCAISSLVLNKLERNWNEQTSVQPYYLDLIRFRDVSNFVADHYGIEHQSPQVLLIKDGKVIYDESHTGIDFNEIDTLAEKS